MTARVKKNKLKTGGGWVCSKRDFDFILSCSFFVPPTAIL